MRWYQRRKQRHHPCVLVGPVIHGDPVAPFNRRVLYLRPGATKFVESGTFGAVKTGGGQITQVKPLGRVAVPFDKYLWIVDRWLEEIMGASSGAPIHKIMAELETRIMANHSPPIGVRSMQLDIFSAVIVNRMEDIVFVYRNPSSFP